MTIQKLGAELRNMYQHALPGEKVTMIHLFAIINHQEILESQVSSQAIVTEAGLPDSYTTEISKAIKLAKYVEPKS